MPEASPYGGRTGPEYGGGATSSLLHPLVLLGMLVAMALILLLPKKYVIVPFLLCVFLSPLGQQVYVLGVHWFVIRLIVLVGLVRVPMFRKTQGMTFAGGANPVDWAFFGCVVCEGFAVVMQYHFATGALANQVGFLIDYAGAYFVVRTLMDSDTSIYLTLKCLAVLAVVFGCCMVREQIVQENAFGLLGGVSVVSTIREGKVRSQASFQHALTAGAFASTLPPLFLLLWKDGKAKIWALAGLVGCTAMTICSHSSAPLLAFVAGSFALCLWSLRNNLRMIRWGFVICLVGLHLAMKAPVWMLIARVDLTGGSSGFHRAELVDLFIKNFSDWWLIGTNSSGLWGYDMWDQQNQYVAIGQNGGLAALVLFIYMIKQSCARIGIMRKLEAGKPREWFFWFLGSALFAHLVGFFGMNYFDQSRVTWFVLLAMISTATGLGLQAAPGSAPQLEMEPDVQQASLESPFLEFIDRRVYVRESASRFWAQERPK